MLEKLKQKGYETMSIPSTDMICQLEQLKAEKKAEGISVAEVGIGIGATSAEVARRLEAQDRYYIFSFEDDVEELRADIEEMGICQAQILAYGNTRKVYDSYVWNLAELLRQSRAAGNKNGFLDLTYLDGAHSFLHDGLACCLLKKLTKPGGVIVFDDVDWTFMASPTANPEKNPKILEIYTEKELEMCQVGLAVELFMEGDEDWKRLEACSGHRAVFKRIR